MTRMIINTLPYFPNNSRGQLFGGRRLFQMHVLLTGSRALNILLYNPVTYQK